MSKITKNKRQHFTNSGVVDAQVEIPLIDRVRLLFGCRMSTHTLIKFPWKTDCEVHSTYYIEKIFTWRRFVPAKLGLWWTSRRSANAQVQQLQAQTQGEK